MAAPLPSPRPAGPSLSQILERRPEPRRAAPSPACAEPTGEKDIKAPFHWEHSFPNAAAGEDGDGGAGAGSPDEHIRRRGDAAGSPRRHAP
ncbi:hypothetical protein TRIUR3_03635 [Triticum urartu]|uniref:Uncharacterized protein n=1 Tax=Triticum urartu TaxID=4572 RepID=M7YN36_TRIUA|nr:hypothetical protein TRIUR3_03635 [Triticum urartu]